jgi:hypothetical protein
MNPTSPSAQPSTQPSSLPTLQPTCSPTSSPSENWYYQIMDWKEKLQASLKYISTGSNNIFTYNEMSDFNNFLSGGCISWLNFINDVQNMFDISYPNGITFLEVDSLKSPFRFIKCHDSYVSKLIISSLIEAANESTPFNTYNHQCGNNLWKIKKCYKSIALCINCRDPCDRTTGDVDLFINPCDSFVYKQEIKILGISFSGCKDCPQIISLISKPYASHNNLAISLNKEADIFCAVYRNPIPFIQTIDIIRDGYNFQSYNKTVHFSFDNLQSSTKYYMYCFAQFIRSVSNNDYFIYSSTFSTLCCTTLEITLASNLLSINSNNDYIDSFLSLKTRPGIEFLLLRIGIHKSGTIQSNCSFSPSSMLIDSSNNKLTNFFFDLKSCSVGDYSITVNMSGPNKNSYDIIYPLGKSFTIISSSTVAPTLHMLSAQFDTSLLNIVIRFSSDTNYAKIVPNNFLCYLLFRFENDSNSTCSWLSKNTVKVILNPYTNLNPGDLINLLPNKLSSSLGNQANSLYAPMQNISITLPASISKPNVILTAPSTVGLCDDLIIDYSMSVGSGGKRWKSVSFSVYETSLLKNQNTATYDISYLFFDKKFVLDSKLVIPCHQYFNSSFLYNFKVKLCNYVGICNSAEISVFVNEQIVPYVSIFGPSKLLINTKDVLTLTSILHIANQNSLPSFCDSRVINNLEFKWSVYQNNTIECTNIKSLSKQRNKFILPPFSLIPKTLYLIRYSVFDSKRQELSSASINVLVSSRVVAAISGGSERIISPNIEYFFNASSSIGDQSTLEYLWRCHQILPIYKEYCSFDYSNGISTFPTAKIKVGQDLVGFKFRLTVFISDSLTKEYDSNFVTIEVKFYF